MGVLWCGNCKLLTPLLQNCPARHAGNAGQLWPTSNNHKTLHRSKHGQTKPNTHTVHVPCMRLTLTHDRAWYLAHYAYSFTYFTCPRKLELPASSSVNYIRLQRSFSHPKTDASLYDCQVIVNCQAIVRQLHENVVPSFGDRVQGGSGQSLRVACTIRVSVLLCKTSTLLFTSKDRCFSVRLPGNC